jgi:hypothetical protein
MDAQRSGRPWNRLAGRSGAVLLTIAAISGAAVAEPGWESAAWDTGQIFNGASDARTSDADELAAVEADRSHRVVEQSDAGWESADWDTGQTFGGASDARVPNQDSAG